MLAYRTSRTLALFAVAAMVSLASATITMAVEADPSASAGSLSSRPDPPPVRRPLQSDAAYQAWFDKFMAGEPAKDAPEHDQWQQQAWSYANYNRDYQKAESFVRALLDKRPDDWLLHDELSVMLGKQGKYQEALD